MLLEVVSFTGDIGCNLNLISKADTGDLPEGGIWFLRRHRPDLSADTPFLRRTLRLTNPALLLRIEYVLKSRRSCLRLSGLPTFSDQLVYGWQSDLQMCRTLNSLILRSVFTLPKTEAIGNA